MIDKKERDEARRDGAKLQKNSGRGQYSKGDAKWRGFLVDYKHVSKSFTLKESVWAKVCTDAFKVGGEPILKIIIGGKVRLAILDWDVLEQLLDEVE